MNGLDGGATKAELMKACGLQPELAPQNEPMPTGANDLPSQAQPQAEPLPVPVPLLREAMAVVAYMLDMQLDRISAGSVSRIASLSNIANSTAFVDSLVTAGHFHKFSQPQSQQ